MGRDKSEKQETLLRNSLEEDKKGSSNEQDNKKAFSLVEGSSLETKDVSTRLLDDPSRNDSLETSSKPIVTVHSLSLETQESQWRTTSDNLKNELQTSIPYDEEEKGIEEDSVAILNTALEKEQGVSTSIFFFFFFLFFFFK
jgi:hypothetical protein